MLYVRRILLLQRFPPGLLNLGIRSQRMEEEEEEEEEEVVVVEELCTRDRLM